MVDPIRVLHVDDDPEFAGLVSTVLERDEGRLDVETAAGAAEALDRLCQHRRSTWLIHRRER